MEVPLLDVNAQNRPLEAAFTEKFREILRRSNSQMPGWLKAGAKLHLARLHDLRGERKQALKLYDDVVDDYEQEPAALAARIGLLTPYKRLQLAAR